MLLISETLPQDLHPPFPSLNIRVIRIYSRAIEAPSPAQPNPPLSSGVYVLQSLETLSLNQGWSQKELPPKFWDHKHVTMPSCYAISNDHHRMTRLGDKPIWVAMIYNRPTSTIPGRKKG